MKQSDPQSKTAVKDTQVSFFDTPGKAHTPGGFRFFERRNSDGSLKTADDKVEIAIPLPFKR